jgi:hypothetical protein
MKNEQNMYFSFTTSLQFDTLTNVMLHSYDAVFN